MAVEVRIEELKPTAREVLEVFAPREHRDLRDALDCYLSDPSACLPPAGLAPRWRALHDVLHGEPLPFYSAVLEARHAEQERREWAFRLQVERNRDLRPRQLQLQIKDGKAIGSSFEVGLAVDAVGKFKARGKLAPAEGSWLSDGGPGPLRHRFTVAEGARGRGRPAVPDYLSEAHPRCILFNRMLRLLGRRHGAREIVDEILPHTVGSFASKRVQQLGALDIFFGIAISRDTLHREWSIGRHAFKR